MGIGRLHLALEAGPVLVALSRLRRSTSVSRGDRFLHWGAGFTCLKPDGWVFQWGPNAVQSIDRSLVHLSGFADQVVLGDFVDLDDLCYPLVCAFRAPVARRLDFATVEGLDVLMPSFAVSIEAHTEEREDSTLLDLVEGDLSRFRARLREFTVVAPPTARQISGCEAVEYSDVYLWAHETLAEWIPTRERVLYVRGAWADFSVRMYDHPKFGPELEFDFDEVVEGLRFA